MKKRMLLIPGAFVPTNDTVTLLTYKRLKHLNLDMSNLNNHRSKSVNNFTFNLKQEIIRLKKEIKKI